jgi:hybrid cluster-associated redox disulfide protein
MARTTKQAAPPIGKETRIDEMIREHPATVAVLEKYGLPCMECALVNIATVELGAERHHLDLDRLLADLNRAVAERG